MSKHLVSTTWLVLVLGVVAGAPAQAQIAQDPEDASTQDALTADRDIAEAPDEVAAAAVATERAEEVFAESVTALDRAPTPSAGIIKGLRLVLNSIDYKRKEGLSMELNLGKVVKCSDSTCPAMTNGDWDVGWGRTSLFANLAPMEASSPALGNFRVGAKLVLLDQASLTQDEKGKIKEASTAVLEEWLRADEKDDTGTLDAARRTLRGKLALGTPGTLGREIRASLEQVFNIQCHLQMISPLEPDVWDVQPSPGVMAALSKAEEACRTGVKDQIEKAREELIEQELQAISAWSDTLMCAQETTPISLRFAVLEGQQERFDEVWNSACEPRRREILARGYESLEDMKRQLESGFIFSAQLAIGSDAEAQVPMQDGDAAGINRDSRGEGALQLGWRWLTRDISFDASVTASGSIAAPDLGALGDERQTVGTLAMAGNVELWPERVMDSSVIVGVELGWNGKRASDTDPVLFAKGQLSLPVHEHVFLVLSLGGEKAENGDWVGTPSFALAWSYERDGKALAREIKKAW